MTTNTASVSANPVPYKLYSERAVWIATFIGSPLAAGILLRKNFIHLGEAQKGSTALWLGIFFTVLLFGSLFVIPAEVVEKVPNQILPLTYTLAIYFAAKKYQGASIEAHKAANGQFYSAWNAAGIGAVCLVGLAVVIFAHAFTAPADFDAGEYDRGMTRFSVNEKKAMMVYQSLEEGNFAQVNARIEKEAIPAWKENLVIIEQLNALEQLPEELKVQNELLQTYCQLRIEVLELIDKALQEDTNQYDALIEQKHTQIDDILNKL